MTFLAVPKSQSQRWKVLEISQFLKTHLVFLSLY